MQHCGAISGTDLWISGCGEVKSTLREKKEKKKDCAQVYFWHNFIFHKNITSSHNPLLQQQVCRDFLRQHQQPRHHTLRLQHSSDKVHIVAISIHCLLHNHAIINGDHRGVSVVEEHGEVWAADNGGDLGGARAFARCTVRQPVW